MKELKTLMRRFLHCVLKNVLPDRAKRLMLLSSLHARIATDAHPDKEIARKLNEVFALSSSDEALLFPMQLRERLWREPINVSCGVSNPVEVKDFRDIASMTFTKSQVRIVSDQILKTVPGWLQYGSKRQMKQDVVALLSNLQTT